MPGFDNGIMNSDGSDVGEFPNTSGADNSTEFNRPGFDVKSTVSNTSNTAGSNAIHECKSAGTSGGAAFHRVGVENTGSFALAITTSGDSLQLLFKDDDDVTPITATNQILRVVNINTVTNISEIIVRHKLTVAGDGQPGGARIDLNSNAVVNEETRLSFINLSGNGDARIDYDMSGRNWHWGVDATESNDMFLTQASASSWPPSAASTMMRVTADQGAVTFPKTPCFHFRKNIQQNNVTGTGTFVVVDFEQAIFDQNNNYDGTNTFTSPVTVKMIFESNVFISGAGGATGSQMRIRTSNRDYESFIMNAFEAGQLITHLGVVCDMDAGDTAFVQVAARGLAGNTANLANFGPSAYFSGGVLC